MRMQKFSRLKTLGVRRWARITIRLPRLLSLPRFVYDVDSQHSYLVPETFN